MDQVIGRHKDVELIVAFLTAQRVERGLTQRDLGRGAGMSQSSVCEIEAGVIPHPRSDTLAKMAEVLGVHLTLRADPLLEPTDYANTVALARRLAERGMYVPVWVS